MIRTAEHLTKQRDFVASKLAEINEAIAVAVADGADPRKLFAERDRLELRSRDFGPAIAVASNREAEAAAKAKAEELGRLKDDARKQTEAMHASADAVDAAIAALGKAYSEYSLAVIDAKRAHQLAGSDLGNVVRSVTHNLRWALARGARHLVEDAGMARVPTHREQAFGSSVRRVTPKL